MSLSNIYREQSQKRKATEKSRTAPRFDPSAINSLKSVSQTGGQKVKLINISDRGALIETRDRLSPGSTIRLRLTIEKSFCFIKGRIIRSSLSPTDGRVFRSAISFHQDLKILPVDADTPPEYDL
jgi:hypothetical protein